MIAVRGTEGIGGNAGLIVLHRGVMEAGPQAKRREVTGVQEDQVATLAAQGSRTGGAHPKGPSLPRRRWKSTSHSSRRRKVSSRWPGKSA